MKHLDMFDIQLIQISKQIQNETDFRQTKGTKKALNERFFYGLSD